MQYPEPDPRIIKNDNHRLILAAFAAGIMIYLLFAWAGGTSLVLPSQENKVPADIPIDVHGNPAKYMGWTTDEYSNISRIPEGV